MYGIDFHFYKIRYTNTKGDWYNGFFGGGICLLLVVI